MANDHFHPTDVSALEREKEAARQAMGRLSISISLRDIYDCLCPSCRNNVLRMIAGKGGGELVLGALRKQLEAQSPPPPAHQPQDPPQP